MSMIDDAKDMARKATNSIIDTAENLVGKPKNPKELASRLVEHLSHSEYTKMAEILSDETKKYAKHIGIDDFALVETKLNNFKDSMEEIAGNMEDGNYKQVASKLKEIEAAVPESMAGMTEIFTSLKSLLRDITKVVEDYAKEGASSTGDKKPDFSKLQEIFEGYFVKMVGK